MVFLTKFVIIFNLLICQDCILSSPILGLNSDDEAKVVLVLGLTGSGKSTTINTIFDRDLSLVGDTQSTTLSLIEFKIKLKSGSKISILDTPGMGDTRGLQNDAQFIASLENYLVNHPILSTRPPDLVLIFSKFADNRISGENSMFVKMIKSINLLRPLLYKKSRPNFKYVFTHFESALKNIRQNPEARAQTIRNTLREYTQLDGNSEIDIIYAENKAEEFELAKDPQGQGHVLSNGVIYPQNLRKSIKSHLNLVGNLEDIETVQSIIYPLLPVDDLKSQNFYNILLKARIGLKDTEISKILEKCKTNDTNSLHYTQMALNLMNIYELTDIPRTFQEIAKLFRGIEIRSNSVLEMIQCAFKIQPPILPINSQLRGIDLISGKLSKKSPFLQNNENLEYIDLGFRIPSIYNCKRDIRENLYSKNSVSNSYEIKNNSGQNLFFNFDEDNEVIENSIIWQKISHSCEISNKVKLDPEIVQKFQNAARKNEFYFWKRTFKTHGSHVVQKFYIGGQIQINFLNPLVNLNWINNPDKLYEFVKSNLNHTLKFTGGSDNFLSDKLTNSYIKSNLQKWFQSLSNFPSTLISAKNLAPYSQYIGKLDSKLGTSMDIAFNLEYFQENGDILQISQKLKDQKERLDNLEIEKNELGKSIELLQCTRDMAHFNSSFVEIEKLVEKNSEYERETIACKISLIIISQVQNHNKETLDELLEELKNAKEVHKMIEQNKNEIFQGFTTCQEKFNNIQLGGNILYIYSAIPN